MVSLSGFTAVIDKIVVYVQEMQSSLLNKTGCKFYGEYDIDINAGTKQQLQSDYVDAVSVAQGAPVKEALDTLSKFQRLKTIREKSRMEFWVEDSVRHIGMEIKLDRKKEKLQRVLDASI